MPFESGYHIEIRPGPLTGDEAQRYFDETRLILGQVLKTDSGNALMTALSQIQFWTSIEPYNGAHGACNSWADPVKDMKVGSGTFRSRVWFTAAQVFKSDYAGLPDEFLHHELVHAMRQTSGKWSPIGLPDELEQYKNWEEFYAVLLTNIYISDDSNSRKSKLLGAYIKRKELEPEFSGSLTFFRRSSFVFPMIDQLCQKYQDYTQALSNVKADFNPIAAYYQDKKAAEKMSNSAGVKVAKAS